MDKKEVFKKFLEVNEVLIVDKNPSSRSRLLKTMVDLGVKIHMIHSVGTFEEAQAIILSKKIGIILSDYFIGGGSGFDLFKVIREKNPDNKQLCLILVTSNISQTAVAKAAEEDVDSFIIKPYTIQSIQENLISTVVSKIQPSEYIVKIEEAKDLIARGEFETAISVLQEARNLHPKPALALFYIGYAEYLKNQLEDAQGSYNEGLNFNNIHYKCLVGLYDLFLREDRFEDAYSIVKKIAKYFPANPDRLTQIVRLAVRTGNYEDMQMYYEIYTTLDERMKVLTNYIGAGMYVAGKYCLKNNDTEMALQYFENIAVSCSEFTKFLRAIVTVLVTHGMFDEAEKFLKRFDSSVREAEDFLISDFLVTSRKVPDNGFIIKIGLDLWNKHIRDHAFLETLVDAMEKGGYSGDKIEPYRTELNKLFPEKIGDIPA
jgi:tetratricopeptide (TPR) repeat protein